MPERKSERPSEKGTDQIIKMTTPKSSTRNALTSFFRSDDPYLVWNREEVVGKSNRRETESDEAFIHRTTNQKSAGIQRSLDQAKDSAGNQLFANWKELVKIMRDYEEGIVWLEKV